VDGTIISSDVLWHYHISYVKRFPAKHHGVVLSTLASYPGGYLWVIADIVNK
jgi:hypothetical protein